MRQMSAAPGYGRTLRASWLWPSQMRPPRFTAAVMSGAIRLKDATCPAIHAALRASEMGNPFAPLRGIIGYAHDHEQTIKLVESGKIDLKPFITGKIGFDGVVDEGFDTLINRNETAVKILVSPEL